MYYRHTAKKDLREYIREQNFQTAGDAMEAAKDLFRETPEKVMAAESDAGPGYSERIMPQLTERQNRPPEAAYPLSAA